MRVKIRGRECWGAPEGMARYWWWDVQLVGFDEDDEPQIIYVGEWLDWKVALRNGILAWRMANMSWRRIGPNLSDIEVIHQP